RRLRAGGGAARPAPRAPGRGPAPPPADAPPRAPRLAAARHFRMSSEDVKGAKGPERLSTDLAELSPGEVGAADPPRRAQVTYYDYKDDTYVTKTVDLGSGKVTGTDTQRGVQPPPNRDEVMEAARLLMGDKLGEGLKKDFKDATGKALTRPDQLTATGFIYRAGEGSNPGPASVQDCGKRRCVRLFTRVVNGPWIDTRQMVVDLSAHKVTKLG
ncbi:Tat pathway signal sequence domain protein, partial [Streptomyces sp. NPDC059455]|uniref:Tat pathway signal sequence domain protein n=1 Tax=Streptomyces sp. NPDC059455 TaxID=3346837 RepID=UPI00369DD4A6